MTIPFRTQRRSTVEMPGSQGDVQLVDAAKSGDQMAFAELWHRYAYRIYNALWRITRNHEDAEDALQEAFLKAFTHPP